MVNSQNISRPAEQGSGMMSVPENEISKFVTIALNEYNEKDEVVETKEFCLEVVDENTTDWQHTFWNLMLIANVSLSASTSTSSNEDKADAIMEFAEDLYADMTLCLRHIVWMADRLRKVKGFDIYCSKLGLNPDCVAQHIVFDGYYKVQAVIEFGVEKVYGEEIVMFSYPIVAFDCE